MVSPRMQGLVVRKNAVERRNKTVGQPCNVADVGVLRDPGVKDEHPRLLQVGPVRRELFVEDEPHPVLVRAALRVAGRVPGGNSHVMSEIF